MQNHSCKTYFAVKFNSDGQKNEVEKFIINKFGIKPEWRRNRFIIGYNEEYNSDVNEMVRTTLKNLFGKEKGIKELQEKFSVTCVLEIVPVICADSNEPKQILSPDKDIINFAYKSNTAIDLDYYVI